MRIGGLMRACAMVGAGSALAFSALPAAAQDASEARVKKLEAEVRALQRKVFPGGDGKYFEAEVAPRAGTMTVTTAPTTTALTDVLARLDALEAQLQRQTALNEESANTIRLLSDRIALLEAAAKAPQPVTAGKIDRVEPTVGGPAIVAAPTPIARRPDAAPATPARPAPAKPAATGPSPERVAAVQAILKPQTNDAGDDEYSYGFRLWDAGFYPEAQQQLTMFVQKYADHPRISFGRNLLGRAYLDDGKAKEAAPWFLKNYQSDKQGARAGDSLLFLARSMIALKDTKRACIALAEFSETYPALATGRLAADYEADRAKVKCS